MADTITLEVTEGKMKGRHFEFEEHDTFVLGRAPDCHMRLPADKRISRHHFLLEANPPYARIRDLGSKNGTFVNGTQYGGRDDGETPKEGAKRAHPEVDLADGDRISVGRSEILVRISRLVQCGECGKAIVEQDQDDCAWLGGTFICPKCKDELLASDEESKEPEPVRCQACGTDASGEIGSGRRGSYLCRACRQRMQADPADLVRHVFEGQDGRRGRADEEVRGLEILRKLGQGAMGAVYLARRNRDGRQMALKIMLSRVAVSPAARRGFEREITLTSQLRHSNIVNFIEHGSSGSVFYFVMEFCGGGSVDKLMEEQGGCLTLDTAGPIMMDALDGLTYAHAENVVHRDLKPGNILLSGSASRWKTKVSDFGLAKDFELAGFSGMTMTGGVGGTYGFMPREQVTDFKYAKPPSDVWSLGATFYNMLTGELPREMCRGQDPIEVILDGKVVPIRERDSGIPKSVAEVIDRALDLEVSARYQDAGEMRQAMAEAL